MGAFLQQPGAQSVAVCDAFTSRRMAAAKSIDDFYTRQTEKGEYKACAICADFRELLADESIDAVVIATPDHWHVPIAMAAVRVGKHVYVEKPLGVAVAWNQALRALIDRYGVIFQYGTQQRSSRNFRFACELTRNEKIGKLERIEAWCPGMAAPGWYEQTSSGWGSTEPIPVPDDLDYDMWLGPAPKSAYTKDRCTEWGSYHVYDNALGFIAGWGAHPLDIAQWGNDTDHTAPVECEGTGKIPVGGLFDTISDWDIHCRYTNGVTMRFMNTKIAKDPVSAYRAFYDHGTTFFGSEGWVERRSRRHLRQRSCAPRDRAQARRDPPLREQQPLGQLRRLRQELHARGEPRGGGRSVRYHLPSERHLYQGGAQDRLESREGSDRRRRECNADAQPASAQPVEALSVPGWIPARRAWQQREDADQQLPPQSAEKAVVIPKRLHYFS